LARWTNGAVVNAGAGRHAHPTQALLDAYTLRAALTAAGLPPAERERPFTGRRLAVVGDVEHSRVARSNAELFTLLGGEVVLCGPAAPDPTPPPNPPLPPEPSPKPPTPAPDPTPPSLAAPLRVA